MGITNKDVLKTVLKVPQLEEQMETIEHNLSKLGVNDDIIINTINPQSEIIKGLSLNNVENKWKYKVGAGSYLLNNEMFSLNTSTTGVKAKENFKIEGKSLKDPFIMKENNVYYMFFNLFDNDQQNANIGYATSTDLINWIDKGIIVNKSSCWGGKNNPIWAPEIKKYNNKYYMWVSCVENGVYKSGVLVSDTINGNYVWIDYLKDSLNSDINAIDISIYEEKGIYYLSVAKPTGIDLYKTIDIQLNRWEFVGNIKSPSKSWHKNLIEAPQIFKSNLGYIMLYGGGDSNLNQRIGLSYSPTINGKYEDIGKDGLLYLDFPCDIKEGSISHPNLFIENGVLYLSVCVGVDGQLNQKIITYKGGNILKLTSTLKEERLSQGVNYIYINPNNEIINSCDLPYGKSNIDSFSNRENFILLGKATFNGVDYTLENHREYKPITQFNAKSETASMSNTDIYNDMWNYLGGSTMSVNRELAIKILLGCNCSSNNQNTEVYAKINTIEIPNSKLIFNASGWVDKETLWCPIDTKGANILRFVLNGKTSSGTYKLGGASALILAIIY